jgi:hypothetical protein
MTQKPGEDEVLRLADDEEPTDPGKAGAFKAISEPAKAPKPAAPAAKTSKPAAKSAAQAADAAQDPAAQASEIDEAISNANILVTNGDLKGGIAHLQKFARDTKKDSGARAKAWAEISKICIAGNDLKNSDLAADEAVRLDPKNIQPWKDVAKAKKQDALAFLIGKAQTAKKDNPEASKGVYIYLAQSAEGSAAKAEGDKKKDALVMALRYYFFADDLQLMNKAVKAVRALDKENSSALAVSAYLNQDNFNKKQEYLDRARKADPKNGFVGVVEKVMQEQSAAALGYIFSQDVVAAEGADALAAGASDVDPETGMRIMSAKDAAAVSGGSGKGLWARLTGMFGGSAKPPAVTAPLPTPAADLKAAAEKNGAPAAKAAPATDAPIPLAEPNTPAAG